ncbi:hypothetical protein D9613_008588 [Agrocybe pediades]|uniref:Small heat shock protein n=1 Tax=Agrocybe pediades TaxID=84607 RepID=A0A8H4QTY1_9AGAR|nr:hypothetical protein D9613_008588 [Agrocybe pediades]KAF9561425.1 small heat shock protein [Agrocybe pediades]
MSVYVYDPFYDIDRLMEDSFPRSGIANDGAVQRRDNSGSDGAIRPLRPRMDLHEDDKKNLVTATFELPGLKKEDVNIEVNNNRLTVSGESSMSSEQNKEGYAVRERRYGKFSRTLQLPQGVKDSDIKASLDQGVLTVNFPKASKEQAHKKITIN